MNIAEVLFKLQDVADKPFDALSFGLSLAAAYTPPKATLAKLELAVQSRGTGELVWPRKLHYRPAAIGGASKALDSLAEEYKGKKSQPRLLIVTDGEEVIGLDTKLSEPLAIPFAKLVDRYDFFLPLGGFERYEGVPDSPADIKAAGGLAKFYDAILEANADWTADQRVHELNLFLTRTLFCLFAQSTGIFAKEIFSKTITECTSLDGSDTDDVIRNIFGALAQESRAGLPAYAHPFPYVNGGLFRDATAVPRFSRLSRRILLDAAKLNWAEINPDIFGSMIQAVVKQDMRDELGMHYTSVPNIMRVLRPLFLDEISQSLATANGNRKKIEAALNQIRSIRVFDPACGSGNFLIIAYKELCRLEMLAFESLKALDTQFKLPFSEVRLENFVGVELEDFAVETAKLSLYIAQHQMNVQFKKTFGFGPPDLPLRDSGQVRRANAARLDWNDACPPNESNVTYIVGNPPYLGGKKLSAEQSRDMDLCGLSHVKQLDYVSCWIEKASLYLERSNIKFAFVSTSSICQGEQVHLMWPRITQRGQEIAFIYEPFLWSNSAKNNAAVACTVVGVARAGEAQPKTIYGEGYARRAKNISPYMIDFENMYVAPRTEPLSELPEMVMGSNSVDGKRLIVEPDVYARAIEDEPEAARFMKRYMGGDEFLSGEQRYCIWIEDNEVAAASRIRFLRDRMDQCREYRLEAGRDAKKVADRPHRFCYRTYQDRDFILVPNTSAAVRRYIPCGFVNAGAVVNHNAFVIYDPEPYVLGLLSSTLHRVWLAAVGLPH